MWKLGLWPRNSFSGNISFKFSVLFLCSVGTFITSNTKILKSFTESPGKKSKKVGGKLEIIIDRENKNTIIFYDGEGINRTRMKRGKKRVILAI
jgi:hypothetical protein